jgi:hypothetical protein
LIWRPAARGSIRCASSGSTGSRRASPAASPGFEVNPSSVNYATVTIGATELSLWTPQTYCPVSAFQNSPKMYQLEAFGTATSAATPGTESINPRVDVVGGSSLGISGATQITPTAS